MKLADRPNTTIDRRQFLTTLQGTGFALFVGRPLLARPVESLDRRSLLVEAAHFTTPGGWKLDNQFHNVLGFSYLLAHGMGRPVANASTAAAFPKTGRYHLWVLTKNWCPGDWQPPGRFKLRINGTLHDTEFGTENGWAWQTGGVVEISEPKATIELVDLTGFEGRCSAIYFSPEESDQPPVDPAKLAAWRREKIGLPPGPAETRTFDVVIVGGGIAGCAAALAAESQGLRVALIQNRPVLGGNASSEIRVHTEGIYGKAEAILSKIDRTLPKGNGSDAAIPAEAKRHAAMNAATGIEQFLQHTLVAAETRDQRILSIDAHETHTGTLRRFTAPVFIDCTGDGWLGEMAGADSRYGRESEAEFDEAWDQHGELWSPDQPDNRVMGTSVLWNTRKADKPTDFPEVPWAKAVAKNLTGDKGTWNWEYSANDLHQIGDAEQIRDHLLRAIYGTFANTQKHAANATLELDWVAFVGGKRESRRLMGDHIFSMKDATESRRFDDEVAMEKRPVDVHHQQKLKGYPHDFLAEALYHRPKDSHYYIPFRTLYSRNVANLMMAGRCFSCSHIGLGGPRVMLTCGQMGVATGYAAALCKQHSADPRSIGKDHISELKELCGHA